MLSSNTVTGWLLAAPLSLALAFFGAADPDHCRRQFLGGATEFSIYPAFQFDSYAFLFRSSAAWAVFGTTLCYALTTWVLTLCIGSTVAPRISCAHIDLANHAGPDFHRAVLDVQHHLYDFVDSVSEPQRHRQFDSAVYGGD